MSYAHVMLIGMVLCIIPLLGYIIAQDLRSRWERMPHFVCNRDGGVYALCSVSDFLTAGPNTHRHRVMVRETLVFSDRRCPVAGRLAGRIDHVLSELLLDSRTESRLFVPFSTSRKSNMDYTFQAEIIREPPRDVAAFIAQKRRQNHQRLFRFRFLEWWTQNHVPVAIYARALALLCFLFFTGYVMDGIMDPAPRTAFMKMW